MARHLLLTGVPGVGKTTVIRRVVESLGDRPMRGFLTDEIRHGGRRTSPRWTSLRIIESDGTALTSPRWIASLPTPCIPQTRTSW
jgi:nucleoside-triphosphatase THEP1